MVTAKQLEWIGGRFPAPAVVTEGDVPYRPEMLLWLENGREIVGMDIVPPGDGFAPAVALLVKSMSNPRAGRPRQPARIRVAEPELASALRAELGGKIPVTLAPTPELDALLEHMRAELGDDDDEIAGYLDGEGATPELLGGFFDAAARLYRAAPWKLVDGDAQVITVSIEALGVRDHIISVIGAMRTNFGLVTFRSREDFEAFASAGRALEAGDEPPEVPPQLAVSFDKASDVPPRLLEEATTHGWALAGPKAFPSVLSTHGLDAQPVGAREFAILEAVSNAVADLVAADPHFATAWTEGRGMDRSFSVGAGGRSVTVQLRVPALPAEHAWQEGTFDIRAVKRDADGAIEPTWAEGFEKEILGHFAKSAEAKGLAAPGKWTQIVLRRSQIDFDATVGRIDASTLRDILFGYFPERVMCKPEEAADIVRDLRAFWTWAQREFHLETASECLAVLRPGVDRALAGELANSERFGHAKSFLLEGQAAGFDLSTEAGLQAWIKVGNARADRQARAKTDKKKARKAKRAARKKNR